MRVLLCPQNTTPCLLYSQRYRTAMSSRRKRVKEMGMVASREPSTSRDQQGSCIFCRIARGEESNKIIYEVLPVILLSLQDESFVAFHDIHPAASQHILVITKAHIPSLYNLLPNAEDIKLVEDMVAIGNELLNRTNPTQRKFGFHYPPFNSVMHIHLHCFELPHTWWGKHKYTETERPWAGYMTAQQLLDRLQTAAAQQTEPRTAHE